jgi:hypothetical protein
MSLKRDYDKELKIPWFLSINWYFFCIGVYYFYGLFFTQKLLNNENILMKYHKFISILLWLFGFLLFVVSLKKVTSKNKINQNIHINTYKKKKKKLIKIYTKININKKKLT